MKLKLIVLVMMLTSSVCSAAEWKGRITMLNRDAGVVQLCHGNVITQFKATKEQLKDFKVGGDWVKVVEDGGVVKSIKQADFS